MVLVSCKSQPDQAEALEPSMHRGSAAYNAMEQPQRTSAGSAAPEPYQILMPVQMADGQITALPPDQAQVGATISLSHLAYKLYPAIAKDRTSTDVLQQH